MSQPSRPADDNRTALTTVANPKRVRISSPVLTGPAED